MKKIILSIFLFSFSLFAQEYSSELIRVKDIIPEIILDLKYSTTDNFTEQKLYTTNECYLLPEAVHRLKIVNDSLKNIKNYDGKNYPEGIGLKIFDGYRPRAVQYLMWEIYPDPTFVADPNNGSKHNRGGAVDLTLVDLLNGEELLMPTEFDDFSEAASHNFDRLPPEILANRKLLKDMMTDVGGFNIYIAEWWHYEIPNANNYPLLDFQMK